MKKLLTFTLILLPFLSLPAQSQISVLEPEFIGQAIYLENDSTGILLQKEFASVDTKLKGSSYIPFTLAGGVNVYLSVNNKYSPNKISSTGKSIKIIIRCPNNDYDPYSFIRLVIFEQKKSKRRIRFMEATILIGTRSNEDASYIPFVASKFGRSSYLLEIDTNNLIKEGEYAIITSEGGAAESGRRQSILTFGYY